MPKPSLAPLSIPLKQEILDRLQTAAQVLNLSASVSVACAADGVANALSSAWRPKRLPASGPTFLAVRLPENLKPKLEEASATAGLKLAELSRISVWAALYKMEGRKQVLWPFQFTKKELNDVVRMYSENEDNLYPQ